MFYKKIFSQAVLNLLNSAVAFLFTYVLLQLTSVSVVGDVYVMLAACSIVLLLQIAIPPSFSVVRIQDKRGITKILVSFYYYVQILVFTLGFLVAKFYFLYEALASVLFALLCIVIGFFNLFDILFQAKARFDIFLTFQIILSGLKLFGVFFFLVDQYSVERLLLVFLSSYLLVLISMAFFASKIHAKIFKPIALKRVFTYVFVSYKITKNYYLTALVKKLFDNSPALIVAPFVEREIIGLFSLYQKCLIFGVSFLRTIETLLLNRDFIKNFNNMLLLAATPICQLFVIMFGACYLFFTVGIDWYKLILISFMVYPISLSISIRAKLISIYRSDVLNKAMLFSLVPYCFYVVNFNNNTLSYTINSYFILVFSNALFLILFARVYGVISLRFYK